MTSMFEQLTKALSDIKASQTKIEKQQKETNKINKEILEQLKAINEKLNGKHEEPAAVEEEPVEEEPVEEPKPTSQDQMNAFFNMMMNTMQAQTDASSNETPYNEYPGYNDTSKSDDEIEAIANRIRNNAAAQEKLNGNNFSSLDNFDYDSTFGGGSSFNQNNEKPPERPVYHRVEAQPKQMNLDGVFNKNSSPIGNNWYGDTQQKEYKLGLSTDRQAMIFRRSYNGEDIMLPPICKGSIAWNTIENKLKAENRKLSSLTNNDLYD